MRALAPLKDMLGVAVTVALGGLMVVLVRATVEEGVVQLVLLTPGLILTPAVVSWLLGLGWFSNLANWHYGASGGPFDPD